MYSHAWTASFERNPVTKPPVNDGTRKPWKKRWIRPVSLAGSPNLFWPVPFRIALAHANTCAYVSALMSAPFGMYLMHGLVGDHHVRRLTVRDVALGLRPELTGLQPAARAPS